MKLAVLVLVAGALSGCADYMAQKRAEEDAQRKHSLAVARCEAAMSDPNANPALVDRCLTWMQGEREQDMQARMAQAAAIRAWSQRSAGQWEAQGRSTPVSPPPMPQPLYRPAQQVQCESRRDPYDGTVRTVCR
jgi:hypothetical protein